MNNSIQIVHSSEIDQVKWDFCLEQSCNSIIYATYTYLSNQCDHWSGLIINDYQTIMPLPWRKKWGVRYFYAPAFIQQLGIFGNLSNLPVSKILLTINQFAKFGDLFFNFQNKPIIEQLDYLQKTNYVLDMNQTYPQIFANYSNDLKKNLQKSEKHNLQYSTDGTVEVAIQQFNVQYQDRFPHIGSQSYVNLARTCLELANKSQCIIRSVRTLSSDEQISTALLLKDKKRIYLLLNTTNNIGRATAANHYLLDQIIQEFCEEPFVFDFEGSERKGIKEFYESFHPQLEPYFHCRFNNLSYPVNWVLEKRKKL